MRIEEQADQLGLAMGAGLFEDPLEMDAHCRQRDAQLVGNRLQPLAAQHLEGDSGFRRRQAIELLQVKRRKARRIVGVDDHGDGAGAVSHERLLRLAQRQHMHDKRPSAGSRAG